MVDMPPSSLFFRISGFPKPDLPLFFYLPGMDGTGQLFYKQVDALKQEFEVHCLVLPPYELMGWDQLSIAVSNLVEAKLKEGKRPSVYLCGESFGGALALKVIERSPRLFTHLVLINPASAFRQNPLLYWGSYLVQPRLEAVYQFSCQSLLNFLAALDRMQERDRQRLLAAMRSVPQTTSIWRLGLLRLFEVNERRLSRLSQPTLLIASGRDRLLDSKAEADRLSQMLPYAKTYVLPESGHACLLEDQVSLYQILRLHKLLPSQLRLRSLA
jgi:pimeloyl-ACP methyl ester carboxylesterase